MHATSDPPGQPEGEGAGGVGTGDGAGGVGTGEGAGGEGVGYQHCRVLKLHTAQTAKSKSNSRESHFSPQFLQQAV